MTSSQKTTPDYARELLIAEATRVPEVLEAMRIYLDAATRVPQMVTQRSSVSFTTSTKLR